MVMVCKFTIYTKIHVNELTSTEGVSADDLTVFTTSLSVISPHSYIITLSTAEVSEPM